MANQINLPTDFKQYSLLAKRTSKTYALPLLNRVAYRYRLAKSFKKIEAPAVGRTLAGYNVLTKLFLSYTAYEAVVRAARSLRIRDLSSLSDNLIIDAKLSESLRGNLELKSYLLRTTHRTELDEKLRLFYRASTNDVLCVACALRNSFAHGDITSTDIWAVRKTQRENIDELAKVILKFCDDAFTRCIARL